MRSVPERATVPEGLRFGEPTWGVAHLFPLQGTWTESEYFALEEQRRAEFSHGFIEFLLALSDSTRTIIPIWRLPAERQSRLLGVVSVVFRQA